VAILRPAAENLRGGVRNCGAGMAASATWNLGSGGYSVNGGLSIGTNESSANGAGEIKSARANWGTEGFMWGKTGGIY